MWAVIGKFFAGIKLYLYAGVAVAMAALFGYAEYEHKGKVAAEQASETHDAEQKAATAVATIERIQTHDQIKQQVDAMPAPAAPQKVADAPAGSAAAKLRDAWSRD